MIQLSGLVVVPGIRLIVGGTYPLAGGDYESFGARQVTRKALGKMDDLDASGGPWLMRVSYIAPHTPVLAPPPFDEVYDEGLFAPDRGRDVPHYGMSEYELSVVEAQQSRGLSAHDVMGSPDDWKLRSCLTLFAEISDDPEPFRKALKRWFDGRPDRRTLELLGDG